MMRILDNRPFGMMKDYHHCVTEIHPLEVCGRRTALRPAVQKTDGWVRSRSCRGVG